jgi:hypothetical protein
LAAPLAHRIGVYSRAPVLRKLDKRTREAGYVAWVKADLTAHVGGNPTVVQRMLIDRATILSLRLAMADARIIEDRLTQLDNLQLIAWQNALTRTLTALGVRAEAAPQPDLVEYLYGRAEHNAQSAHRRAASEPTIAQAAPSSAPSAMDGPARATLAPEPSAAPRALPAPDTR